MAEAEVRSLAINDGDTYFMVKTLVVEEITSIDIDRNRADITFNFLVDVSDIGEEFGAVALKTDTMFMVRALDSPTSAEGSDSIDVEMSFATEETKVIEEPDGNLKIVPE